MSEQAPHVEVFSRNKVNRSRISFFIVLIPVTVLTGLVAYALLPFLWLIGDGVMVLAAIGFVYLVALLYIDIKRRALTASVVHLGEHGAIDAEQWRMLPLALPAPVIVTEEKADEEPVARVRQALDVLEVHSHGVGIKSIAASYKESGDTYWTEWRVRQVIEAAKDREVPVRKP